MAWPGTADRVSWDHVRPPTAVPAAPSDEAERPSPVPVRGADGPASHCQKRPVPQDPPPRVSPQLPRPVTSARGSEPPLCAGEATRTRGASDRTRAFPPNPQPGGERGRAASSGLLRAERPRGSPSAHHRTGLLSHHQEPSTRGRRADTTGTRPGQPRENQRGRGWLRGQGAHRLGSARPRPPRSAGTSPPSPPCGRRAACGSRAAVPSSVCSSFPVAMSKMLMMPSMAPLARYFPSGLCTDTRTRETTGSRTHGASAATGPTPPPSPPAPWETAAARQDGEQGARPEGGERGPYVGDAEDELPARVQGILLLPALHPEDVHLPHVRACGQVLGVGREGQRPGVHCPGGGGKGR